MGLEGDGDLADLGHAFLGRIFRVILHDTLFLDGFRPVFFEKTITYPFVARAGKRFGKDTAVAVTGQASVDERNNRQEKAGERKRIGRPYLSCRDWKSLVGRSSGCAISTVGRGLPGWMEVGRGGTEGVLGSWSSSSGGAGVVLRALLGVAERWSGGVAVLPFLAACSTRAAARAGSFLFLSMSSDGDLQTDECLDQIHSGHPQHRP